MEDQLSPLLSRMAAIRQTLAPLEAQIKPLTDELDTLKSQLMLAMQSAKSKRTEAVHGLYAVRSERKTMTIIDPAAVDDWLTAQDFDLGEYYKLDDKRVKAAAESAMKENGEIVPGIQVTSNEYLMLKESN